MTINAPSGTYTLADALSVNRYVNVVAGNFRTAGNNVTVSTMFGSSGSATRSVDITNSLVTITGAFAGQGWKVADTGLTLTTIGSTIAYTYVGSDGTNFIGGTQTYNNIQIAPGSGVLTFSGAFTFNNMTMSSAGSKTVKFTKSTTYTMTGTNFLSGTAGNLVTIDSDDGATQFTLAKASGSVTSNWLSLKNCAITAGATWTAFASTNAGNNSVSPGWIFPKTAVAAGGNWSATTTWSDGVVPTASTDVYLIAGSGAVTIDAASVAKSLDCTGYTNTLTHNAFTLTVSGNVTLAAGKYSAATNSTLAINATGTLISAGNTLYNLTTSVGTVTLGDGLAANGTVTVTSGTFITDGGAGSLTHTWKYFDSSNSNTRTITLGNSTINIPNTNNNAFFLATTTNMTLNANTSTINMIGDGCGFKVANGSGTGRTFNIVNFTGSGTSFLMASGSTFATLTRTGTAVKTDGITIYGAITVTGTLNLSGNTATNRVLVQSGTIGTPIVITVSGATVVTDNVDIQDITFARSDAGALDLSAGQTRSVGDCGGNTKTLGDSTTLTFTTADTQTWNAANGGNWSGANWTGTSISRVPLPQDDVNMARVGGYNSGVTVTADMPRLGKSIDWTGATWTGAAPIFGSGTSTMYGSLTMKSGVIYGFYSLIFAGRSSYTITNAGAIFGINAEVRAPGGTYTLTDNLQTNNVFYLTCGTFVTAGHDFSPRNFSSSNSNTRTLDISNSMVYLGWAGAGNGGGYWGTQTTTGMTFISTNSTIDIIDAGAGHTGNFLAGNLTFNDIQIAPSTGILTTSGAFTFANMTMSSAGTKTVKFTKATTYTMTGTNFLNGTAGNMVTLDTNDGTGQFTLNKTSGTVIADYDNISRSNITGSGKWYMTANSVNGTNNTGWLIDATPPTNPTVSSVNVGGTGVTSGTWINYNGATNFNWSGSADPDSGLAGYYTYFGTDASADPVTYQAHTGAVGDTQTYSTSVTSGDDGKHFYFRLKTKDAVGNIGTVTTLFDFGYDTTLPTRPTFVAANPAGYSTVNSFDFTWPAGGDANGPGGSASGIKWYEYKRATDGAWSHTADANTRTVAAITAYQEGANAFYVRTVDNAGNISSNYQQVTYYWSGVAPAKPTSLAVSPDTSDSNLFTISWHKPAVGVGDPPVVGYRYSINAVPTMTNTTYVASSSSSVSVGPDAFATLQGLNTVYVLSVNAAGNYSLEDAFVASATFTCQTTAPPAPTSASISDSSDRALSRWILTLQWQAGVGQDPATFSHYVIYRSTDGLGFTQLATTTSTAYADSAGLNNSTTYYYNIKAVDNAGNEGAQSTTVSKQPTGNYQTPPTYLNAPVITTIKASSAHIAWSTDRASSSIVRYGKSKTDLSTSSGQMDSVTSHAVDLLGLDPGVIYYFEVQSLDENRDYSADSAYSTAYSFETLSAPAISNVQVNNITLTSADISWITTTVSTSALSYGQNSSFAKTIQDISGVQATHHSVKLSDLTNSTTYAFRISATDIDGNALKSDNYNFETLPMPRVDNLKAIVVLSQAQPQVKVDWTTNVATSSTVQYAAGSDQPKEKTVAKLVTEHEIILDGLENQSTYKITASGADSLGNLAEGSSVSVQTPVDARPPVISEITVGTSNVGLNKLDTAQVVIFWKTDELATSQVEYGVGLAGDNYTEKSAENSALSLQHVVIVPNLTPASLYHLRVVSADKVGNVAKSDSQAIVSATVPRSTLSILLAALQKAFSWVKI